MKKLLFLALSLSVLFAADAKIDDDGQREPKMPEFLGNFGKTWKITEENGLDLIERRAKEISQEEIKKNAEKQILNHMTSKKKLPFCKEDKLTKIDIIKRAKEAFLQEGQALTPQALERLNMIFEHLRLDYYVMDVSDLAQIEYAKSKDIKTALILGGYVYEPITDFIENRYIYNDQIEEILNIRCTPSHATYDKATKTISIQEINIERSKK